MEFPSLGTHCALSTCSKLDFLPFECDACHKIFCLEHKTYEQHGCTDNFSKDVRVPVCPLCNQLVPVNRGEDPNAKVDEHIQKDCKSDEKAKKAYSNRCSFPGCKKKELVPVTCSICQKNFCLKHRFETSHNCTGHPNRLGGRTSNASRSRGGPSRANPPRTTSGKPQMTTMSQLGAELNRERLQRQQQRQQPSQQQRNAQLGSSRGPPPQHMTEDEALAVAIAASMNDTQSGPSRPGPSPSGPSHSGPTAPPPQHLPPSQAGVSTYDDDEALAKAIAASLNEEQPKSKPKRTNEHPSTRSKKESDSCSIS